MLKAFLTGGTGFIGSILTEELLKKGFYVYALVRDRWNLKYLKGYDVNLLEGSLQNLPELPEVDYIFHLAGVVRAVKRETYYEVNTNGTINLFEKARNIKNLKKFVFLSTQAASGPGENRKEEDIPTPLSHYGLSKLLAEDYIKKHRYIPWVILKPSAVYGPRDKDIYEFFKMINRGFFFCPSGERRFLSMVYVYDLVMSIIEAGINENCKYKEYFIAYPEVVSWDELAKIISLNLNRKFLKIKIPVFILKLIGFFNDIASHIAGRAAKINSDKVKEMLPACWNVSSEKFIKDTDFEYRFDKIRGIKNTVEWYKKNRWL